MVEIGLDSQFWHACAGEMAQMPSVNTKIFYFPQGHAEHTHSNVDFSGLPKIPPLILCRVSDVKLLADPGTDEVYARIQLVPIRGDDVSYEFEDDVGLVYNGDDDKSASFAKTLTQSDANNGGGFSVPRYCAETIFPMLDYAADPPVQTVVAKDVLGETWKFRHIYRGTPRRHLLTTGWSSFVNQKKLVAGDSIVFLKAVSGELYVGIRRAKRGGIGGLESPSRWNTGGGFSVSSREVESKLKRSGSNRSLNSSSRGSGGGGGGGLRGWGKSRPESVIESVFLAARGQPFEVMYYPRASTPEFFVKASSVSASMHVQWCPGMRFKMPFDTEDSSRITWFTGTVASVQVSDPIAWPNSPWKLLQVTWDEPELLHNVKQVNPWLVELLTNIPPLIHPPSISPPKKKLRLPQLVDFSLDGRHLTPPSSFSGNPFGPSSHLCCPSDNSVNAGIQGVRHAQLGVPLPDLHLSNNLHLGLLLDPGLNRFDQLAKIDGQDCSKDVSCLLTMRSPTTQTERVKNTPRFLLFGQPILTEQQMSNQCCSDDSDSVSHFGKTASLKTENCGLDWKVEDEDVNHIGLLWNHGFKAVDLSLDTGNCKVFLEYEDVGRSLDLSVLNTYDELYKRLGNMFGIEKTEIERQMFYFDSAGTLKHIGEEPFSHFMKTAKRLTISTNSGGSGHGRKWITGLPSVKRGLESANQTGPLSILA